MAVLITEGTKTLAGTLEKTGPKRFRIKIIDEGVGSSGTYPAATLELAAKEGVFGKGVHMYLDHPTALESMDRPERTVKDLAAVLDDTAVYEESALYAPIKAFSAYADTIEEMKDDIGVSIRATAEIEEADGERIVTRIVEVLSVDFVTKAGRGGKVMEVLESARAVKSAIRHGVSEATANDTREWLSGAVRAAHAAGEREYAWVRDFDESTVWFEKSGNDSEQLYQQGYTLSGNTAELTGDPIPVRIETRYVPISPATEAAKNSVSDPAAVTERKEPTVATTQIEEAELATLKQDAGRVTALEAENKQLRENAVKAEAASIVAEAFDGIDAPKTIKRLSESYTLNEDGTLNTDALKAEAEESAAEWKTAHGEGTVRGLGASEVTEAKEVADGDILQALKGGK